MCETGVDDFLEKLRREGIGALPGGVWESVADGFRPRSSRAGEPALLEHPCPRCQGKLAVVRRSLISEAYNLPDAAVYQRLKRGTPCVAMALVDPRPKRTTMIRRPGGRVREAWQSMM